MTIFKAGETYRTRDGREARVYATGCGREDSYIHGAILKAPDIWMARTWRADGSWIDAGNPQDDDLMPPAPTKARPDMTDTPKAEKLTADMDAGREWMRCAWRELNAIRARDGAPVGVSPEWWDTLTEALGTLLADDRVPWMTGAARKLIEPYEAQLDASRADLAALQQVIDQQAELLRASRAETEAVRRERDDLRAVIADLRSGLSDYASLRSLAAELVEGLEDVAQQADVAMRYEGGEGYHAVEAARALLSRARAQGIGEKEKG